MIVVDLSKEQAIDPDPKSIQQNNFTANLFRVGNTRIFYILKQAKKTVLDYSQETVKFLLTQFSLNTSSLNDLIFISMK